MSASKPRLRSVRAIAFASASSSSTIRSRCPRPPASEAIAEECKGGESWVGRYRLSDHGEKVQMTLDLETRKRDKGVTVLAPSRPLESGGGTALRERGGWAMKRGE